MPRPMKQSGVDWLGDIPADWNVLSLGAVTDTMRNGYVGPTKDLFVDDGIKYIQSLHIKDGRIDFSRHEYYVSEEWANTHPKIKENDVLIVQTGDIGNVGLVTSEYDGCNCHALIIATPRTNLVFPNYLTYYLRSVVGRELLLFYKTGALLPHLNSGKIKFASVCVPPLDEQQRIANFLDDKCVRIDSVIEKTRASIVEYKKLKQAVITRAVTRGIRPARPTKFSGVDWLGEIPTDWELVPIKHLCSYNDEVLPENTDPDFTFDYIEIGSVEFGRGIIERQHIQFVNAPSRARRIVHENDIIVSTVRTYLKAVAQIPHSDIPLIASTGFVVIRPRNVNHIFLKYAILSNTTISMIESNSVGISYPAINASQLVRFKIPIPPIEEQKEIAQYLDEKTAAIDSLVAKKNQLASELEQLKKSLIFEYVTGKKELAQ